MLQARPEVHRDRAQLQFDAHGLRALRQEDRHLQNQVQAAVAIGLWGLDIVFFLDQRQVVLPHEHIRNRIDILDERADHADAADIVQILHHGLERDRIAAPLELADDAARGLDTAFDRVDRAGFARDARFIAQDIQLGLDLADAGFVQQHDLLELHGRFDQLLLIVLGQTIHRKKISKIHCISSVNCGIILPLYYSTNTPPGQSGRRVSGKDGQNHSFLS